MVQLELFFKPVISLLERKDLEAQIRSHYWFVRAARSQKFGGARRRKAYRSIAIIKKRLEFGGVEKRDILDLLACCRSRSCHKIGCKYCGDKRFY